MMNKFLALCAMALTANALQLATFVDTKSIDNPDDTEIPSWIGELIDSGVVPEGVDPIQNFKVIGFKYMRLKTWPKDSGKTN